MNNGFNDDTIKDISFQRKILHTLALYIFDPYLDKKHYVKTDQPELSDANMNVGNEIDPTWDYQPDEKTLNDKIIITNNDK